MDLLNPLLLSILTFGIVTSYTDIRYGKIKNVIIIIMLLTGLFLNIFFTNLLLNVSLDLKSDFVQTIINFFVSLGFGFFIWNSGLWAEGDAKLFLGYSLLLPVFTYKHGYITYFPALNILINTFIPIAAFIILFSLIKLNAKLLKMKAKQVLNKKSMLNTMLMVFILYFLTNALFDYIKFKPDLLLTLFAIFILIELVKSSKFLSSNNFLFFAALLIIIFYFNSIIILQFFERFLFLAVFIVAMTVILPYSIEHSLLETVRIENLKEGMILGEPINRKNNYAKEEPRTFVTLYSLFRTFKESLLSDTSSRLTKEDVKNISILHSSKKLGYKEVKIAKTVPFAPFMFFGVLLTYFLQGSLFYYLHL